MTDTSSFLDFSWADPSSWFSSSPSTPASQPSTPTAAPTIDFANANQADTFATPGVSPSTSTNSPGTFDWSSFLNPSSGGSSNTGSGINLSSFSSGSSAPSVSSNPSVNPGTITPAAAAVSPISAAASAPATDPTLLAASTTGTPAPGGGPSQGTVGQIMDALGLSNKDLLKAGVAGGGLLANLLNSGGSSGAQSALKSEAASQSAQGQQLESYLQNGTLPPGAQSWVDSQTQAAQAQIRAKYAADGLSGSSMEADALASVQQNAANQMFEIASSLLNTGISETNASGTLYNYLMQQQTADNNEVSSAINNFVSSLAGSGSGVNIKVT